MISPESKIDWLFRIKRKMLLLILLCLAISIITTVTFIAVKLRDNLVRDSKVKTGELAYSIRTNLHHLMILRQPGVIQDTLEKIVQNNDSITHTFILNNEGRVSYSSDPSEIDHHIDREAEASCVVCHNQKKELRDKDVVLLDENTRTHRNVTLLRNEQDCYECHDESKDIIGKLIIDRSLDDTYAFISEIQQLIVSSGIVCLIILMPLLAKLLSRGVDRYILEIFTRKEELQFLYAMVEKLSQTLELELLKKTIVDIFTDFFAAEEVELVLDKGDEHYSASYWNAATNKLERGSLSEENTADARIQQWIDGKIDNSRLVAGPREIYMPVIKGDNRLAVIVARTGGKSFDAERLKLCSLISSHIAVSLDNARLYNIATTDELTGTFTKRHFTQSLGTMMAESGKSGESFSLLMMDLDKFKQVNDTFGHVVGDSVLRTLGRIIRETVRENDLSFRYGGEEFAVILPDTDSMTARSVAERIRSVTESLVFEAGSLDLKLTISIGVASCAGAGTDRDLIVAADRALYAAKAEGRNQVVVSDMKFDRSNEDSLAP